MASWGDFVILRVLTLSFHICIMGMILVHHECCIAAPLAAITNCPKLTGLKQHVFLRGQKSGNGSTIKVLAESWFFLETLEETLFPCLFQLLDAACISWLVAPSSSKLEE